MNQVLVSEVQVGRCLCGWWCTRPCGCRDHLSRLDRAVPEEDVLRESALVQVSFDFDETPVAFLSNTPEDDHTQARYSVLVSSTHENFARKSYPVILSQVPKHPMGQRLSCIQDQPRMTAADR